MDHVGVVVDDLEAAIAFFVELGMELEGEAPIEGRWVDRLVGLDGVRVDIAMMRTPDGHGRLELTKFHTLSAHVQYMDDFAARLEGTGEFVDGQALSPEGMFVRYDGEGRPPVTDGPFAETKDLIAGWMVIDVETYERALELAGELSAAPGAGGKPIHEWLEVRPFLTAPPTITE
jgi:hypothetical protein